MRWEATFRGVFERDQPSWLDQLWDRFDECSCPVIRDSCRDWTLPSGMLALLLGRRSRNASLPTHPLPCSVFCANGGLTSPPSSHWDLMLNSIHSHIRWNQRGEGDSISVTSSSQTLQGKRKKHISAAGERGPRDLASNLRRLLSAPSS